MNRLLAQNIEIEILRASWLLHDDIFSIVDRVFGRPFQHNIFECWNCTIGNRIQYDSIGGCILDRWDFFVVCTQ